MSLTLTVTLASGLVVGGMTTPSHANRLPDDRPQAQPWLTCETIEEEKVKVRFCAWGTQTAIPNEINMRELFAILSQLYMDDEDRIDLTVMIEPYDILNNKYWGVYLPPTGNIIVVYPWDDDQGQFDHTIMHEMLHALWDIQGIGFEQHHQRIYCQEVMKPLDAWIAQYDKNKDRTWVSMIHKMKHCGEMPL